MSQRARAQAEVGGRGVQHSDEGQVRFPGGREREADDPAAGDGLVQLELSARKPLTHTEKVYSLRSIGCRPVLRPWRGAAAPGAADRTRSSMLRRVL